MYLFVLELELCLQLPDLSVQRPHLPVQPLHLLVPDRQLTEMLHEIQLSLRLTLDRAGSFPCFSKLAFPEFWDWDRERVGPQTVSRPQKRRCLPGCAKSACRQTFSGAEEEAPGLLWRTRAVRRTARMRGSPPRRLRCRAAAARPAPSAA